MKDYEELANRVAEAQKQGDYRKANDLLLSGSESLAKRTGQSYYDVKEMVCFCLGIHNSTRQG